MSVDQIFLSWSDFFKLILEALTLTLPIVLFTKLLPFNGFAMSIISVLGLLAVLFVIMKIFENKMFEVIKGMLSGKIWFKKQ